MNPIADLKSLLPELCLIVGAFSVLTLDLFLKSKKILTVLTLTTFVAAVCLAIPFHGNEFLFFGFFTNDAFTHFFRLLALGIGIIWVSLSAAYKPIEYRGEFLTLALFVTLGLILMAASTNLMMIFLSVEFVSIVSYLLAGFEKKNAQSKEASMKYLIFGSVASALMLYGMSFVFGASGSLELSVISEKLSDASFHNLTMTGCILILAGIGFKISMAPFHVWAPDVYEGAPTPVTAFLTVGPKALGFAVLMRLLAGTFDSLSLSWSPVLIVLSILTMTIGNVTAVTQTNIKRMLAYSSIAQAGYILIGLASASLAGLNSMLYYLLAYSVANLGVFAIVMTVGTSGGSYDLESFKGLSKRSPALAFCMVVFLLSLAGIPPLAGFFAKLFIFSAAIEQHLYLLTLAAVVNSAIAAYYYLRIIRQMYFVQTDQIFPVETNIGTRAIIYLLLAGTLLLGIMPEPFLLYFQSIFSF